MGPKRRKLNNKKPPTPSPEDSEPTEETPQPQPMDVETFTISFPEKKDKLITCQRRGQTRTRPEDGHDSKDGARLIFTHGAGGGLEAAAIKDFSTGFARTGEIVCFKGTLHMPSRIKAFGAVMEHEAGEQDSSEGVKMALGGRSMGARAAAMTASLPDYEGRVEAVVLVSFPLMSDKGESREEVLLGLPGEVDVLLISGDRDSMCELAKLEEVVGKMLGRVWMVVVEGASHGMELRKSDGDGKEMREMSGGISARWLESRDEEKRFARIRWDGEEGRVVEEGWQEKWGTEVED